MNSRVTSTASSSNTHGTRTEDDLSDGEALTAYRDLFGFALDRLPIPLYPEEPT